MDLCVLCMWLKCAVWRRTHTIAMQKVAGERKIDKIKINLNNEMVAGVYYTYLPWKNNKNRNKSYVTLFVLRFASFVRSFFVCLFFFVSWLESWTSILEACVCARTVTWMDLEICTPEYRATNDVQFIIAWIWIIITIIIFVGIIIVATRRKLMRRKEIISVNFFRLDILAHAYSSCVRTFALFYYRCVIRHQPVAVIVLYVISDHILSSP